MANQVSNCLFHKTNKLPYWSNIERSIDKYGPWSINWATIQSNKTWNSCDQLLFNYQWKIKMDWIEEVKNLKISNQIKWSHWLIDMIISYLIYQNDKYHINWYWYLLLNLLIHGRRLMGKVVENYTLGNLLKITLISHN